MEISKQSSSPIITLPPSNQLVKPAHYLIAPFKIYILAYLLQELYSSAKQQCFQLVRRCSLHLKLSTHNHSKRKNQKIRTEWDVQTSFQTKQESIFSEEKDQMTPIYHRQYQYLPERKGYDGYRYKVNAVDYSDRRYLYSGDYHGDSVIHSLTNQIGSYDQNQYASPYRKKRNTAFVDQGRYEDKGLSIVLKDIPSSNLNDSRQKQEDNRKMKSRTSKIIGYIIGGSISRYLSFSFMRISLSSTLKKYQIQYNNKQCHGRQAQTQTDQQFQEKNLSLNAKQNQSDKLTKQLGKISIIFFKINAIYRYLLSISFSQLKKISIIEVTHPVEVTPSVKEISQSENRCVPIDSSASDEQEVTIKYIDDEGVSANSTILTSMSVLSFGEGGSSQAPFSQRSRETDAIIGLD